jgi:hypothetical protein
MPGTLTIRKQSGEICIPKADFRRAQEHRGRSALPKTPETGSRLKGGEFYTVELERPVELEEALGRQKTFLRKAGKQDIPGGATGPIPFLAGSGGLSHDTADR